MLSEDDRTVRVENRNLVQLQNDFEELRKKFDEQLELLADTVLEQSAELDRLHTMTETQCRGANVPLTPFHGHRNEDFAQYLKQFELICDANNYAMEKRAQILASYLRDKAFFIYDSLTPAVKADYDQLKAKLCDKFQTTDYRRYAHQKFQERKQFPSETVPDYACDVHKLGLAALAAIEAEQRDTLIREKFIAGLLPQLRELIVYSNPTTFHEAMTLAERLEGLQAIKPDHSAKNILLLENISERLANLEVSSRKNLDARPGEVTYVMDAPVRRIASGPITQQKYNLGNFRQDFRPSGMVCYRCNRTGHMARNCGRNREMNTVVCRLCNRMGHFARNCQRRVSTLGRRPAVNNFKSSIEPQHSRFPMGIGGTNRTMALSMPHEEEGKQEGTDTEIARWQPLVATLWHTTVNESTSSAETTAIGVDGTGLDTEKLPKEKLAIYDEIIVKISRARSSLYGKLRQLTSVPQIRAIYFALYCVMALVSSTVANERYATYRTAQPMLCQASDGKALWKLPVTFNCPEGNHTVDKKVTPMKVRLYKRNYVQYKSDAWKCVRMTEEVHTFSYFFGDENLKKQKKYTEAVSEEDCISMKNYKSCGNQPMIFQGGIYQTNNKLNWYYPGGGINCCHWKPFKVTNCYMYKTHVYKRHSNPAMESTAGDVSNCDYRKGKCVLSDRSFLIWDFRNESFCDILPWKKIRGKIYGTSWLSDDSNLALTFTRNQRTTDCRGRPLLLSDQGIAVRPIKNPAAPRGKRDLTIPVLKQGNKIVGKGGVVSTSQMAASLQALEMRWEQNMKFTFSHALNNVCNFMRSVIEILKTQVLGNPTMAIRSLTNQSDVFARSGGNVIEVFPCSQLNPNHYSFKPMNGTCSSQLPIKFKINNKTNHGYLDPITNIIHRFAVPTDCNLVKQVPVQIEDKTFIYHASNGELTPAHNIPTIKVLQWNIEPVIDMKATIFHEIVIYNWDELQTHISLNDIIGGLDRQRTVLQHIGITDADEDPGQAAENAVTRIMQRGYFGFLHGLTANIFQVWTFLVCVYVTLCVVIVHCVPLQGMPVALNMGNTMFELRNRWKRWRRQLILRRRASLNRRPQASAPPLVDDVELGNFMTLLSDRLQHEAPRALMPPPDANTRSPTASIRNQRESVDRILPRTMLGKRTETSRSSDIQPFRINMTLPISETAVLVTIDGFLVESLLDTGATNTIISSKMAKQLKKDTSATSVDITTMSGHKLPLEGETQLIVKMAGKLMQGRALVMKNALYELILGTDFMKQLGNISINLEKRIVLVNHTTLQMKAIEWEQEPDSHSKLRSKKDELPEEDLEVKFNFCPKTFLIGPNLASDTDEDEPEVQIQEVVVDRNGYIAKLEQPRKLSEPRDEAKCHMQNDWENSSHDIQQPHPQPSMPTSSKARSTNHKSHTSTTQRNHQSRDTISPSRSTNHQSRHSTTQRSHQSRDIISPSRSPTRRSHHSSRTGSNRKLDSRDYYKSSKKPHKSYKHSRD